MKRFRLVFLLLSFALLCQNLFAQDLAELYGQILYRDGKPARQVSITIFEGKQEVAQTETNSSGFFSVELRPGEYLLKVNGKDKDVFLSPRGTSIILRIGRN